MSTIGLIRHGSTIWNKEGRAQGSTNVSLDEEGITQAKLLANRLVGGNWTTLYSSNLFRAHQTAELIAQRLDLPILFDERLKEMGGGLIEGTTENERIEKWGTKWREQNLGIENTESIANRGIGFLKDIVMKHKNQNILVVSHGALIQYSLTKLLNDDTYSHYKNASMTIVEFDEKEWNCKLYNCTKHLSI